MEEVVIVASKLALITKELKVEEKEITLQPHLTKSASVLASSLMHEIHFPGNKSRKVNILYAFEQ